MRNLFRTNENMDSRIPFKIFTVSGEYRQPPHSHEYLQMWYILNGSCQHVLNGHMYEHKHSALFLIPPYSEHYLESTDADSSAICCEFSERFINEALANTDRDGLFDFAYLEPFFMHENLSDRPFELINDSRFAVENLLLDMLTHFRNKNKYSNLFIKADLLKLLAIIASEYEAHQSNEKLLLLNKYHSAIDNVLEYLDKHFSEKIYLEDMCKTALMSQTSFSYIFKQVTRLTFNEYLVHLRTSKAQELLKNTQLSASDIACACGFGDATYFSHSFRRATGMSPTQYRKTAKFRTGKNQSTR